MPCPPPSREFPPTRLPTDPSIPYTLGVDEAGRGPVLGPLVYCLFIIPNAHLSVLKTLGAADSKALSAGDREVFFKRCVADPLMSWKTHILNPSEISRAMLRKPEKYNLNELSYDTVYGLLANALEMGLQVDGLFVDTLGKPESYKSRLEQRFPTLKGRITVTPKADSLFPVVSAASIIAKVTRDYCLENWVFDLEPSSRQYGCGYPSDPQTVKWLHDNVHPVWGYPDVVRFSWSSSQRILDERARIDFAGEGEVFRVTDENADGNKKARRGRESERPRRFPRGMAELSHARIVTKFITKLK